MSNNGIVTDANGMITHINRRSEKFLDIGASRHVGKLIHKNSTRCKNPFVEIS